ncbi:hypothetical protein G7K_2273-t1 [Saitoella complicata NRRL Y-17804]|uniref:Uncharacterized protein n=1 Tax=Saitoella complicata (strain BCRC 22490 / CBS 7301 / JCM 7358 / NBRC 10748 / NRRL Y-17804) TaxID=698492 RepID=A0A0E9NEG4_SAICN|nr:hypothetical protein G7K_2273-t1 [Saitoella complicata NRRL Y-17804]
MARAVFNQPLRRRKFRKVRRLRRCESVRGKIRAESRRTEIAVVEGRRSVLVKVCDYPGASQETLRIIFRRTSDSNRRHDQL